jgi:class 3 adenylate cyclase/pimeloyl-ACP methyl ester carboxylesterase
MVDTPRTSYARSGDVSIAYQLFGQGPPDLVFTCPTFSHLGMDWEGPDGAPIVRRMGSFARVIRLDRRGSGLSDRTSDLPTLEEEVEDLLAVLDAAQSERPYFLGVGQAGSFCLLFAALHPDRCAGVVAWCPPARVLRTDDYPFGWDEATYGWWVSAIEDGTLSMATTDVLAPSWAGNEEISRWRERYIASAVSPAAAARALRAQALTDIRDILPIVQVPVLVLHRGGGDMFPAAQSKDVADRIPGATFRELPGDDWMIDAGDRERPMDEVQTFITGVRPTPVFDRVLSTVLFTDIVGSTTRLSAMGDQRWVRILEDHDRLAAQEIEAFRGRRVKTTGDGVVATFDGPARAIRCAQSIQQLVRPLGIAVRAGLHTGEIETRPDNDIAGLAVHIASRVASLAGEDEILVSRTVVDLVAGSGIDFEDKGERELKGVDKPWQIFGVAESVAAR